MITHETKIVELELSQDLIRELRSCSLRNLKDLAIKAALDARSLEELEQNLGMVFAFVDYKMLSLSNENDDLINNP